MGRYYCSRGCGYCEEGIFEDIAICEGFNGRDCRALGEDICSRCMTFEECSVCGVRRCDVCMSEGEDCICVYCAEAAAGMQVENQHDPVVDDYWEYAMGDEDNNSDEDYSSK